MTSVGLTLDLLDRAVSGLVGRAADLPVPRTAQGDVVAYDPDSGAVTFTLDEDTTGTLVTAASVTPWPYAPGTRIKVFLQPAGGMVVLGPVNVAAPTPTVICTATTRPGAPVAGQQIYETDTSRTLIWNGVGWVTTSPQSAADATSSTRANAAYGNLAVTVGPTVSLWTGTRALVRITAATDNAPGVNTNWAAVAVSGATTIAASDALALKQFVGTANGVSRLTAEAEIAGLTPGENTFTVQYRCSAGTGTWLDRQLTVVGLL